MQYDESMAHYSSEEGMLQSPPTTSRSPGMQMHLSSRSQTTIDDHFGEGGNRESMATNISEKRVGTFQDKDRDRVWPVATPVVRNRWWKGVSLCS